MKINGTTLIELTEDDVVDGKLTIPDEVTHIADGVGMFLMIIIDAIIAPNVLEVGDNFCIYTGYTGATELNFPKLTTAGECFCYYTQATELNFPKLTTVKYGFCCRTKATELNFPKLTMAGNSFCYFAKATELPTAKGVYRRVDNSWFRAERTKTRKGITVHYGELLTGTKCYVAEKNGYFAHGSTAREAVNDVEFKILRKNFTAQPISPDDIIDVNTYRLYTGACSFGVRAFLRQHKIADKPYKASEILPKLRALNAYGIEDIAEYYDFGKRAETPA